MAGINPEYAALIARLGGSLPPDGPFNVGVTLRRAGPIVASLFRTLEAERVQALGAELIALGQERHAVRRAEKASYGLGASSVWGALMSEPGRLDLQSTDGLDLAFALFVAYLVHVQEDAQQRAIKEGAGPFLRKCYDYDEVRSTVERIFAGSTSRLTRRDLEAARRKLVDPSLQEEWVERLGASQSFQFLKRLLQALVALPGGESGREVRSGARKRRVRQRFSRRTRSFLTHVVRYEPGQADAADEEGLHPEDERHTPTGIEADGSAGVSEGDAQAQAYVSHQVRLDGQFVETSQQHLTLDEAAYCARTLLESLAGSPTGLRADAIRFLCLAGIMNRDVAKVVDQYSSPSNEVWVSGEFQVPIPEAEDFWNPIKHGATLAEAQPFVCLQLPHELLQALKPSTPLADEQRDEVAAEANRVATWLRKDIASRFSVDRWRATLPLLAFKETRDVRVAQLLSGDRLGMSGRPLYYAAYPQSVLRDAFSRGISRWWDVQYEPAALSPVMVGSSLGAVSKEGIRAWVDALRPGECRSSVSLLNLLEWVGELSRWTAWMVCAATGFRNKNIGRLSRLDFSIGQQLACLADKVDDAADCSRAVGLGELAARQLGQLIRSCQYLRDRLAESLHDKTANRSIGKRDTKILLAALDGALSGSGSLFLKVSVKASRIELHPGDVNWMLNPLKPFGIPENCFRHVLASRWVPAGGEPADLFAQLGHSQTSAQPFGAEALRSVEAFRDIVGPVVDRVLSDCGWQLVEGMGPNINAHDWQPPLDAIERDFKASADYVQVTQARNGRRQRAPTRKHRQAALVAVQTRFSEWESEPEGCSTPYIRSEDLDDLAAAAEQSAPNLSGSSEQFRRAVCQVVREAVRAGRCTADRLPVYVAVEREAATIFRAHLHANAMLERVQAAVFDGIKKLPVPEARSDAAAQMAHRRAMLLAAVSLPVKGAEELLAIANGRVIGRDDQSQEPVIRCSDGSVLTVPGIVGVALASAAKQRADEQSARVSLADARNWVAGALAELPQGWGGPASLDQLMMLVRAAAAISIPGFWNQQMRGAHVSCALDPERAERWSLGGLAAAETDLGGNSEGGPAVLRTYGASEGGRAKFLVALRNAIAPRKERRRTVDAKNVDLADSNEMRRTLQDVRRALVPIKRVLDADSWQFGIAEVGAVRMVEGLCQPGAKNGADYAVSTIGDYLSLVSKYLLPAVGAVAVEETDADEWLELYLRAAASAPKSERGKCLAAYYHWHRAIVAEFGVSPLPRGSLWSGQTDDEPLAADDACLVTSEEARAVQYLLDRWSADCPSGEGRRLFQIACLLWPLLCQLGLRGFSEAMALQHRDHEQIGDRCLLHIRGNALSALKSNAARRTIDLGVWLDADAQKRLAHWIEDERAAAGPLLTPSKPLFPELQRGDAERRQVWEILTRALRAVTGRIDARMYWARHGFATNQAWLLASAATDVEKPKGRGTALSLQPLRVGIGHAALATTVETYIHVRQRRFATVKMANLSNTLVAAAAGRKQHAHLMWIGRRGIPTKDLARQIDALLDGSVACNAGVTAVTALLDVPRPHFDRPAVGAAVVVGRVLHLLWHGHEWHTSVWRAGLLIEDQRGLFRAIQRLAARIPENALSAQGDKRIRRRLDVPKGNFMMPATSPNGGRRHLAGLPQICENLDRHLAGQRAESADILRALDSALMFSRFRHAPGVLKVADVDDLKLLHCVLTAAFEGAPFTVGISTLVQPQEPAEMRGRIEAYLAGLGVTGIPVVFSSTTGSESVEEAEVGLVVLRASEDGHERATTMFGAVLSVLLVTAFWRQDCAQRKSASQKLEKRQ